MLQPIDPKDLQPGDEITAEGFRGKFHKIVSIEGSIISFIHAFDDQHTPYRTNRSGFSSYKWMKKITELKYDPEQMLADEDDL